MKGRAWKIVTGGLAVFNLGLCLTAAVFVYLERLSEERFKTVFLLSSLAYFVLATAWSTLRDGRRNG